MDRQIDRQIDSRYSDIETDTDVDLGSGTDTDTGIL